MNGMKHLSFLHHDCLPLIRNSPDAHADPPLLMRLVQTYSIGYSVSNFSKIDLEIIYFIWATFILLFLSRSVRRTPKRWSPWSWRHADAAPN